MLLVNMVSFVEVWDSHRFSVCFPLQCMEAFTFCQKPICWVVCRSSVQCLFLACCKAVFKHLVDNRYWNLFLWVKNNVSVSLFLSMFRKMYTVLVILGNKIRASLSNQAFLKTLPSRFCKFTVLSSLFLSAIAEQVADAYTRWWK